MPTLYAVFYKSRRAKGWKFVQAFTNASRASRFAHREYVRATNTDYRVDEYRFGTLWNLWDSAAGDR